MSNWILNLILGVLAIVLGFVALAHPFAMSLATEIFVGWSFIIMGIVVVISAFTGNETNGRIWTILLGVLMFITGFVLLKNPLAGILAISIVVGIMAIVSGVVKFVTGWKIRNNSLKWLTIISGVASVILGILIFQMPIASLGLLVSLELIFDGVALCALAFSRKSGGVEA